MAEKQAFEDDDLKIIGLRYLWKFWGDRMSKAVPWGEFVGRIETEIECPFDEFLAKFAKSEALVVLGHQTEGFCEINIFTLKRPKKND